MVVDRQADDRLSKIKHRQVYQGTEANGRTDGAGAGEPCKLQRTIWQ